MNLICTSKFTAEVLLLLLPTPNCTQYTLGCCALCYALYSLLGQYEHNDDQYGKYWLFNYLTIEPITDNAKQLISLALPGFSFCITRI